MNTRKKFKANRELASPLMWASLRFLGMQFKGFSLSTTLKELGGFRSRTTKCPLTHHSGPQGQKIQWRPQFF